MKPGAVIQARMSSHRLPGKVLKDLCGEPLLARVAERVRQARSLAFVGVAASVEPDDDPIAAFCREQDIPCHRGLRDDVLARTAEAAAVWALDPVVRITADCPFVYPELIDRLVATLIETGADAITLARPSMHEGIDPFSRRALERWDAMPLSHEEREHLALLPERRGTGLRIVQLEPSPDDPPPGRVRLSIDEPHQLAFARATYAALGGHARFTTAELLQQLANDPAPTGADAVVEALLEAGVPRLHLYPGGTIIPTLNAWIARGGEFIVARHEQGAGYAALAEARLSGEPRVVMVTSGPGVTNLMTVLPDAWYDGTPFIAITGQVGTADLRSRPGVRQRGFQEVPTSALCAPISKACLRPMDASEVPNVIARAFAIAREGRPGPVVIELPMDVQRSELGVAVERPSVRPAARVAETLDLDAIGLLAEWLREAERPLILAGQGVLQSGSTRALLRLAERAQVPVGTSLLGVGAVPGDHPLALGMVSHTGTGWANRAMAECDLLLVLGARLDVRQTGTLTEEFASRARIVRIDIDAAELAEPRVHTELPIRADVSAALADSRWDREGTLLRFESDRLRVHFDIRRGLAIDAIWWKDVSAHPLVGTLRHGFFDDIAWATALYTGHAVFQAPGTHQITDLSPIEPFLENDGDRHAGLMGTLPTPLGPIEKHWQIDLETARLRLSHHFYWPHAAIGSLRLGHVTLIPGSFTRSELFYRTCLGGGPERFELGTQGFDQGRAVSSLVSSSSVLGMTEGWLELGDREKGVRIEIDTEVSSCVGLLRFEPIGDSFFLRATLSAQELEDTSQPVANDGLVCRFTLSAQRRC